jgi:hypothetical protein
MHTTDGLRWLRRWTGRHLLAGILVLEAVVVVLIVATVRASRRDAHIRTPVNEAPAGWWMINHAKPIIRPPILKATEAKLRGDDPVIGVEAGGNARAYRLNAFNHASGHLINDLIGSVPVSVAYSNLSDCVRVYTDPQGSEPLDVQVPGLLNGEMVVKLAGIMYFHSTGMPVQPGKNPPTLPFSHLTPTRTTWKEWVRQHPKTDVYVGGR